MKDSVFEAIMRRPTLLIVGVLLVCLFGLVASLRIPVQMIPDLDVRVITVITQWPGATPQDIENEILIEQEQYLRNVLGLQRMLSTATTGRAEIELEFPFSTDVDAALIRVTNALTQVSGYPEAVDEPRLVAASFSQNSFMYFNVAALEGNPANLDMNFMRDYVDLNVRTRMEQVPGVADVEIGGGAERQIKIHADPARLAAHGLPMSAVRDAVRARNRDVSGGDMNAGKRRYLIRTVGRFQDVETLESVVLQRNGDSVVTLGDVARVELDHAEVRQLAYYNLQPVISLSVRRQPGSNVLDIKQAMLAAISEINAEVLQPNGMRLALTADDVRYLQASINSVWRNLAIGAILATLTLFMFLRSFSATLIAVVGIPVCTIAAFLGLLAAGRTINVISLAGIAFAIGMTLDNSIVVLENIERELGRGKRRWQAALDGVREVWPAVLASTLTTIMVFAPVLFIRQEAGQLYSDIAIAISTAILTSMFMAILVVPTAAAYFLSPRAASENKASSLRAKILASSNWLIAGRSRRTATVIGVTAFLGMALWLLTPPAEYLPQGEEAKTFSAMLPPPGYNLDELSDIAAELREFFGGYLVSDDDAAQPNATDGTGVPPIAYFNMGVNTNQLRMISEPADPKDIDALMDAYNQRFKSYPGMRAFSTRGSIISGNEGGTRAINLDISGPDLAAIYQAADAAYSRAEQVFDNPQVRAEPASLALAQPLIEIQPDYARLAELGLDAQDIGFATSAMVDGAYVDEYYFADDKVDIYLYGSEGKIEDVDAVSRLPVVTANDGVFPLLGLANVVPTVATDVVRRLNSQRTVTLRIIPPDSVPLEAGVARVKSDVISALRTEGEIPVDVTIDISGASDDLSQTRAALSGNYAVALLVCYLLLVAIFAHWGYPLLILTTVPLGIAGGIAGLWLLNLGGGWLRSLGLAVPIQPFDLITMLGFLILVGTVVNNPILIVERARANIAQNMQILAAVSDAVSVRLRPILMTTITTALGLAPLVFLPGAGTELYRGLGAIVMFGLLVTMITSLTFLPALLTSVLLVRERLKRLGFRYSDFR